MGSTKVIFIENKRMLCALFVANMLEATSYIADVSQENKQRRLPVWPILQCGYSKWLIFWHIEVGSKKLFSPWKKLIFGGTFSGHHYIHKY